MTTTNKCSHTREEILTSGKIIPIDGKITWHIESFTPDMDKFKVIHSFEKAFQILQPFFPVRFTSVSDVKEAQIVLRFRKNGDPDLPSDFGFSTLAYAYLAQNNDSLGRESDVYFNEDRSWAEMHKPNQFSLLKVAVHEIGHAIGLHHSTISGDIMYPTYEPNDDINFTQDTLDGITSLYGPVNDCPGALIVIQAIWGNYKWWRVSRKEINNALIQVSLDPKNYKTKKDAWKALGLTV